MLFVLSAWAILIVVVHTSAELCGAGNWCNSSVICAKCLSGTYCPSVSLNCTEAMHTNTGLLNCSEGMLNSN